jgi:DNA-binding CsgD family transcriptional regulator
MAFLEVFDIAGSYKVELAEKLAVAEGDSVVLGRSTSADIVIDDDEVSRRHLELRPLKDQWTIEDLGSANGTQVNGDELMKKIVLHDGNEIRVGATTIAYRDYSDAGSSTDKQGPTPDITKTERAVLKELCRQYFATARYKGPATRDEIAAALFVGAPAVQAHLSNLYLKFDIDGPRGTKRQLLAEKVLDKGVITRRDYPADEGETKG